MDNLKQEMASFDTDRNGELVKLVNLKLSPVGRNKYRWEMEMYSETCAGFHYNTAQSHKPISQSGSEFGY